jgi:recombination protein RecA
VDVEHALDPNWATTLGVDVDNLLVSQPDYGEQALSITETLIETRALDVIVVDSVAALIPKAELDGEIGDAVVGLQARLMSQAMRKFTGIVARSNGVVIFINQIREKIGVTWGSPETTAGGRALKFYASVRLDVRRIGGVKKGEEIIGNKVKVKAAKNKVAAPFREAEVELLFDRGFNAQGSVFDAAVESKIIDKKGAWFSYKGQQIGQGRDNSIEYMVTNDLMGQVLEELRKDDA